MLLLASSSPQRREILTRLGLDFRVQAPAVQELEQGPPQALALGNARLKADAAEQLRKGGELLLTADTVVALDGQIFGKAEDEAEARAALSALAGRRHSVYGALVLRTADGSERTAVVRTQVRMRPLEPALLDWYIAAGEWPGRAGSYAIQHSGSALVQEVCGDYENVVGLSVNALHELLPGGLPAHCPSR